jgi:hypothetical protein
MTSTVHSIGDKLRDVNIVRQEARSSVERVRALVADVRAECTLARAGQPEVQERTLADFLELWNTLTSMERATLRAELSETVAVDLRTTGSDAMKAVVRARVTNDLINITKHQGQ